MTGMRLLGRAEQRRSLDQMLAGAAG